MSTTITPSEVLCAAAGCEKIGIRRCGRCKDALYCSIECQTIAFPVHKGPCKVLAAATKTETSSSSSQKSCAAGCGKPATLRCSRCLGPQYCSKVCSTRVWPDHKAQCKIGVETRDGRSIDQYDKDFETYKQGAAKGDALCQQNLATCYQKGSGVEVDYNEAFKWYKLAAENGNVNGQFNLGACYSKGDGVIADQSEAVKWYTRAAIAGHPKAMFYLGSRLMNGRGIAVDQREGLKWIKRADEKGDSEAKLLLTVLLQQRT